MSLGNVDNWTKIWMAKHFGYIVVDTHSVRSSTITYVEGREQIHQHIRDNRRVSIHEL
jgi:hypothetical protein